MAYAERFIMRVDLGEYDFGADADETGTFRLPPGYQGKLIDIGVMVSEAFACTTTPANVMLGTTSDADAYAKLLIADTTADNDCFDVTDDTDAIIADDLPANTLLKWTLTQSTDDSSDTGKGRPFFVIECFK